MRFSLSLATSHIFAKQITHAADTIYGSTRYNRIISNSIIDYVHYGLIIA